MKNAIITGANGFVGAAVAKELVAQEYTVYAVGHRHFDRLPEVPQIIKIFCDMAHMRDLVEKLPIQDYNVAFHFAWEGSAGEARGNTKIQLQNVQGTIDFLQACHQLGCRRVVCAGSIMEKETMEAVYGNARSFGIGNVYGGAKIAAHIMGMSAAAAIGVDLIWAMITNAYGPGEVSPRLVNTTIQKCLRGISPQFTSGVQNYDFVYIDDVARAFRLIGEKGKVFQCYLIGSGTARPLKEFLLDMKRAIAPDLPFEFGGMPFKGISLPLDAFDCSRIEKDTGFKAEIPFFEGCQKTAEWWEKHLSAENC